ncbi:MAG: gliding motility-associated C-terminal domain-containing protein [Saprospiraceae bacterium]
MDYLDFYFPMGAGADNAGYQLLEGDVRSTIPSSLNLIECGVAKIRFATRFIEFPCILKPNTTYSLALIFHRDFSYSNIRINVRQRSVADSGWPLPILPPANASNQLGILPGSVAPGTLSSWTDRFNCNSFLIDNVCPPANPASGTLTKGTGMNIKTYNMSTWATFTLNDDSNVEFRFNAYQPSASYYTRIFSKSLSASCPSPNLAGDLYLEFPSILWLEKCMPAGDYSIQVLSNSASADPPQSFYNDAWTSGALGTEFTLGFKVVSLPSVGLFRLDASDMYDGINNFNPLLDNVTYTATPSVFICKNTVLPGTGACPNLEKAIYREINIGDATGDGIPDDGLLCMSRLRVDAKAAPPIAYSFFKGDANQLANGANTHAAGQLIPGLVDYAGFCINQDDDTLTLLGLPNFCACVTSGIYTLASYGNVDNVSKGDSPDFRFNVYTTIHDSRPKAELINIGAVPGTYLSGADVFSCQDNPGLLPTCAGRKKLIYREFFLPADAVAIISEVGNSDAILSLFTGRASDLSATLDLHTDCFTNLIFYDFCTPLEAGWYTIISYGAGPNYTTNKVLNQFGNPGDVGRTTRISIALIPVITPNYNRPNKAYQAGVTDWFSPPAGFPNALTRKIYQFPNDTFCDPDTPFIPSELKACMLGYNRISMYVFEITKPSFVQIRNLAQSYYTEVFPFDVNASPASLLTVPPVYPCVSLTRDNRQLCDIPPGKYTICIFANDSHKGLYISPSIYVDEAAESRFDHSWNAYDFDLIPLTNTFVNGRALDVHPTYPGQAPSRDVFYCTTGATIIDPNQTQCDAELNHLVYANPPGVPKPLFLQGDPPPPALQPWRTLWYTFKLSGSGICTIHDDVLSGSVYPPLVAVYESAEDGTIPWSTLQTTLIDPANTVIPGLRFLKYNVSNSCDAKPGDIVFTKSGCIRDNVRYYVLASFDTQYSIIPPNLPNQVISVSVKYDPRPTFTADYDERLTANFVNGLMETVPPYTAVKLAPGNTFTGPDFSLLCYTKNVTDPAGCDDTKTGKSAWFQFDASATGHFYAALQEINVPNGWFANVEDLSLWRETSPGGPLEQITMDSINDAGHEWVDGCINRGTYFLLVRHCLRIDTIQPYRVVLKLADSGGDFCSNAILLNITNATPITQATLVDCHTIGTDVGEFLPAGNACFSLQGRKTTWYHAVVNAGPMVDLNFQLGENFQGSAVNLNDLSYRILAGTCGAMTPIVCSATGTNVITLNCLAPGDYYVQVSEPERVGPGNSPELKGNLALTITATPSDPLICTMPIDPNQVNADFSYTTGCQSVTLVNLSTAGSDIAYLWQFPDGTSTLANPTWTPPAGSGSYSVTLTVTNIVLNTTATTTLTIDVTSPFSAYVPLADTTICNNSGNVILDASIPGATYVWDDGSINPQRITNGAGTYSVVISKDGCEKRDTAIVGSINATRFINPTICPEDNITIHGEIFNKAHSFGTIVLLQADPSGCDSLINVNVNFYPGATSQLAASICEGDSYSFGNQTLTQTGLYTNTLNTVEGCDSVVTLQLTVKTKEIFTHNASGCTGASLTIVASTSGATYLWSNGAITDSLIVNVDGTYSVSVSDADNCLIAEETFNVTFGQLAMPAIAQPGIICPGSDVTLTATGSSGNYNWYDDPGRNNLLFTGATYLLANVLADDTIYVSAYDPSVDHCISLLQPVILNVENLPVLQSDDEVICAGTPLLLPWGENVVPDVDTSYIHSWQNVTTGCDSVLLTVNVGLIYLTPVSLPSKYTLQLGDSVLLVPQIEFVMDSARWTPVVGLSCADCLSTWASPEDNTEYMLSVWSEDGCLTTAIISIEVRRDVKIYIPNVFTPDGDGVNDKFTVYANKEIQKVRKLMVFDRWGEAVWQGVDFLADGSVGWDGMFRGKAMMAGVYAWVCQIELVNGTMQTLKGDVTLVR